MSWISVKDRLPEENGRYLCYSDYGFIDIFKFATNLYDFDDLDFGDDEYKGKPGWIELDDDWGYYEIGGITHWMPLPEPPVEDFADDYIMPKKADHRKQRGRTAPNMTLTSPYEFVYCDECHYNSDKCPDDMRCENTLTQLFDRGCYHGRENKEE